MTVQEMAVAILRWVCACAFPSMEVMGAKAWRVPMIAQVKDFAILRLEPVIASPITLELTVRQFAALVTAMTMACVSTARAIAIKASKEPTAVNECAPTNAASMECVKMEYALAVTHSLEVHVNRRVASRGVTKRTAAALMDNACAKTDGVAPPATRHLASTTAMVVVCVRRALANATMTLWALTVVDFGAPMDAAAMVSA